MFKEIKLKSWNTILLIHSSYRTIAGIQYLFKTIYDDHTL